MTFDMEKEEYEIKVVFSITLSETVRASNLNEAMESAEELAYEDFYNDFYGAYISPSDFACEVLEP